LPHDDAVLHHEADVLNGLDVVEGVAGDGDDVGEEAGLELSHRVGPNPQMETRGPM